MKRLLLGLALGAALATPALAQQTAPPDVDEVDTQPSPIAPLAEPAYPADARRDSVESRVTMRVWVRADGSVADVQPLRGESTRKGTPLAAGDAYTPVFTANAVEALRAWRFSPAIKDGKAVDVWVTVPIRFRNTR